MKLFNQARALIEISMEFAPGTYTVEHFHDINQNELHIHLPKGLSVPIFKEVSSILAKPEHQNANIVIHTPDGNAPQFLGSALQRITKRFTNVQFRQRDPKSSIYNLGHSAASNTKGAIA